MKTMKIKTSITKEGRKQAAKELGEALGFEVRYLGVPSCAYGIGEMRLEKDGSLTVPDDEAEQAIRALKELGFEVDSYAGQDDGPGHTVDSPDGGSEEATEPVREEDADDAGDEDADDTDDGDGDAGCDARPQSLAIEMPRSFFNDQTLENLQKLISSKVNLIRKAVGAEELPVTITDEKVTFPWFTISEGSNGAEEAKAYSDFVSRLSAIKLYRDRWSSVDALKKCIDEGSEGWEKALWTCVEKFQNYKFMTAGRGRNHAGATEFTYELKTSSRTGMSTDELIISTREAAKSLTKSSVELGLINALMEQDANGCVSGPKKLQVFGASYLYAMFVSWGVISNSPVEVGE